MAKTDDSLHDGMGEKGSGDSAEASQFPEASSAWNWQVPANFRKFIVEDGEGGGGSLGSRVSRGVPAGIGRLALICMARGSKGQGPEPAQRQMFKCRFENAQGSW